MLFQTSGRRNSICIILYQPRSQGFSPPRPLSAVKRPGNEVAFNTCVFTSWGEKWRGTGPPAPPLATALQRHRNASAVTKLSGARESWKQFQIIKNYHRSAWVSILLSRRVGLKNSRHRIKKPKERAIHTSMYEQGLTTKSQ